MDNSSWESFPADRNFTVLAVSNDTSYVPFEFDRDDEVQIIQAKMNTTIASLIDSHRVDLVVIQEENDWKDVKVVMDMDTVKSVDTVIVQGQSVGGLDHLRAILAGADMYAPQGDNRWRLESINPSAEKPVDKLARELTDALRPFGAVMASNLIWEMTKGSDSRLPVTGVKGLVRRAARQVNDNLSDKIIMATLPYVRKLLDETSMEIIEGTQDESTESSDVIRSQYLYWNVKFPEDLDILSKEPHGVTIGRSYLLETSIEPEGWPNSTAAAFPADQLVDKKISFTLTASNGQLRSFPDEDWSSIVISEVRICSDDGTSPFQCEYRALEAGSTTIELTLCVNGGNIAQQVIELKAIADGTSEISSTGHGVGIPLRVSTLTDAPDSDLFLIVDENLAVLQESGANKKYFRAGWSGVQPVRGIALASLDAYTQLSDLSKRFNPTSGMKLSGIDGDEVLSNLATIGSKLYRALFKDWHADSPPAELEEIRKRMFELGDIKSPPVLQIMAPDIPLPWGILYDGNLSGSEISPKDIERDRFWGMRFDIYRYACSDTEVPRFRGNGCVVKPIVGKAVPRSAQQLDYIEHLSRLADPISKVRKPAQTIDELLAWAANDDVNDLLYFYCHAVPGEKALVFGPNDQAQDRVSVDDLTVRLGQVRRRNPVVILNACSSAQVDPRNGKPFVDFFMKKWGAQAFIGTDWSIQAILADAIGKRLLAEIYTERRSLRMALRAVISAGAAEGNYFPLMYAIYGPNNIQFTEA